MSVVKLTPKDNTVAKSILSDCVDGDWGLAKITQLAEDGVNSMVGREDPYGSLSFNYESLNLPRELEGLCGLGWKVIEYFEQIQSSATLFFDKSTGRLRYIFTGFMDEHTNYMPPEILRMHLHALCDEAVRG